MTPQKHIKVWRRVADELHRSTGPEYATARCLADAVCRALEEVVRPKIDDAGRRQMSLRTPKRMQDTYDRQRAVIKALTEAIETALQRCPENEPPAAFDAYGYRSEGNQDDVANDVANEQLWRALSPLRAALSQAKELGDG